MPEEIAQDLYAAIIAACNDRAGNVCKLDPEIVELRDLYLAYEKRKVEEELIKQPDIVSRKDKTTRDENNTNGQTNTEDEVPK